jgi:hypothetical protein
MNLLEQTKIIAGLLPDFEEVYCIGQEHRDLVPMLEQWCETIVQLLAEDGIVMLNVDTIDDVRLDEESELVELYLPGLSTCFTFPFHIFESDDPVNAFKRMQKDEAIVSQEWHIAGLEEKIVNFRPNSITRSVPSQP